MIFAGFWLVMGCAIGPMVPDSPFPGGVFHAGFSGFEGWARVVEVATPVPESLRHAAPLVQMEAVKLSPVVLLSPLSLKNTS